MLGESNGPALAGIRPAPLCREYGRKSRRMVASASNLPSLARLGMFKAANDSKSRFIHKHMKMAAAGTLEPETAVEIGVEEWLQPRHWGAPGDVSMRRVSERLGVMSTEKGLEEYARSKRAHIRQTARRQPEVHGNRARNAEHFRQSRAMIPTNGTQPYPAPSGFHLRNGRANQPPAYVVRAPKRGKGFAGVDGVVMKRSFPRISESGDAGSKFGAEALSKREGEVVRRLCDPKLFTGTAATGHLPTTVDLEGGVGVLLKDASITVKDHVGAQEVSWRLRLAERL